MAGRYTYGTENITVHWENSGAKLEIGSFCQIAFNLNVYLGGGHRVDWITTYPFGGINREIFPCAVPKGHPKTNGDVIIGNDVWIANNVTIMSGVTIGHGCVIANNSHVVKDCESYGVYGGNPAKLIRKRFSEQMIKKLLEFKWWDLPESKITELVPILCSNQVDKI